MSARRGLGVAVLACLAGGAQATILHGASDGNFYGASIEYVSGGAIIRDGSGVSFQGRNWDVPSGRTVRATDTNGPLRLGGNTINVNAARTMTPLAINRAAAIALKALAPVAVGLELWELYNDIRVRPGTCAEGGLPSSVSDVLCFDEGVPTGDSTEEWRYSSGTWASNVNTATGYIYTHQSQACEPIRLAAQAANPSGTIGSSLSPASPAPGQPATCNFTYNGSNYFSRSVVGQLTTVPGQCPASIDASNPANNIPAGLPVGEDGKCRTGRYNAPITPNAAADKLEALKPPSGVELKDIAQDVLARGGQIEASERVVNGPASVTGTPTTTTTNNPGGTTTTVTKTPTTNYTYNNNTVNYTTTTVTVTNNAGDVTTTTETEGTPQDSEQCKTNPDSLGCAKMGQPGTEAPAWQTRDVVFAPEDLGFEGACPSPESWEVFGITLAWGYEPVCDVAPIIRLALLVFAALGSIAVVIRETSS